MDSYTNQPVYTDSEPTDQEIIDDLEETNGQFLRDALEVWKTQVTIWGTAVDNLRTARENGLKTLSNGVATISEYLPFAEKILELAKSKQRYCEKSLEVLDTLAHKILTEDVLKAVIEGVAAQTASHKKYLVDRYGNELKMIFPEKIAEVNIPKFIPGDVCVPPVKTLQRQHELMPSVADKVYMDASQSARQCVERDFGIGLEQVVNDTLESLHESDIERVLREIVVTLLEVDSKSSEGMDDGAGETVQKPQLGDWIYIANERERTAKKLQMEKKISLEQREINKGLSRVDVPDTEHINDVVVDALAIIMAGVKDAIDVDTETLFKNILEKELRLLKQRLMNGSISSIPSDYAGRPVKRRANGGVGYKQENSPAIPCAEEDCKLVEHNMFDTVERISFPWLDKGDDRQVIIKEVDGVKVGFIDARSPAALRIEEKTFDGSDGKVGGAIDPSIARRIEVAMKMAAGNILQRTLAPLRNFNEGGRRYPYNIYSPKTKHSATPVRSYFSLLRPGVSPEVDDSGIFNRTGVECIVLYMGSSGKGASQRDLMVELMETNNTALLRASGFGG